MRTFFVDNIPDAGGKLQLAAAEAHHALRVLRLREGDAVRLLDGRGRRAEAVIAGLDASRKGCAATCRVTRCETWSPPTCRLRLLVAPPRTHLFGPMIQEATALGVSDIAPILCEHSVAKPGADGGGFARWQAEAIAALKQSGNAFLPRIAAPATFAEALAATALPGFFGDAGGDSQPARLVVDAAHGQSELSLWVGPEGGFSAPERRALADRGFRPVRLGNWVLRIETAVTALLGLAMGAGGDDLHSHPLA